MKWNDPKEKLPKFRVGVLIKMIKREYGSEYLLASREYEKDNREWYWVDSTCGSIDPDSVIGWLNPEEIE